MNLTTYNSIQTPISSSNTTTFSTAGKGLADAQRNDALTATASKLFFNTIHDYASAPAPRTFKEAMDGPKRDEWLKAFLAEIDSVIRAKVWYAVPLADVREGYIVLGGRWVTKRKLKPDGTITRHKARYVSEDSCNDKA